MGFIPNHGGRCEKAHSKRRSCSTCNEAVIYIECTCKQPSRFYLNPKTGVEHNCIDPKRRDLAAKLVQMIEQSRAEPDGTTKCPMCKVMIKNKSDNARKHFMKCPNRVI